MLQHYVLNVGLQWLLFLSIPIIIYLIFFRKQAKIFSFFGLKTMKKADNRLLIITSILSVFYLLFNYFVFTQFDVGLNDARFLSYQQTGLSVETFLILLINSIIQTSLLEEIMFRGFLLNVLNDKFSFSISNHTQAAVFTGIHVVGTIQMGLSLPFILLGNLCIYLLSIYWGKLTKDSGYSIYYATFFHSIINLIIGLFLFLPI